MDPKVLNFLVGTFSAFSLLIYMALSVYSSNLHFWPPASRNWKWAVYWILATTNTFSIIYLLLPEFKSITLSLNSASSLAAITGGLLITLTAIKQLGLEKTSGVEGQFYNEGLYRYSRNPQVVGNLITLFGVASLLQSFQAFTLCLLTGLWLITMVFSEEKWLREKYGQEYRDYMDRTPRFI